MSVIVILGVIFLKKLCIVIVFILLLLLSSCHENRSCSELLSEFGNEYSIYGNMYTVDREFYEEGYISEELFREVYIYSGDIPPDYAIFLNSRPSRGEECGIFSARDADMKEELISMCYERIALISEKNTQGFVMTSENFVFYSTLSDSERAKTIFSQILK